MTPSALCFVATTSGVPPLLRDGLDFLLDLLGQMSADANRGSHRPHLCGTVAVVIHAAHARLRGERDKLRVAACRAISRPRMSVFFFREHDDAAAFGRFVGERRKLRGFGQLLLGHSRSRNERRRLAIAERDRAGLVEQQHIHIAGGFDRAAAHGQHILLHQPIDPGDADGAEQSADRGRESNRPAARPAP